MSPHRTALLLFSLASLLYAGCKPEIFPSPGSADFSTPLGGGYTLNRTSSNQVYISLHGGLGDDVPKIAAKVLRCAVHKNLILAERQPLGADGRPVDGLFEHWILDTAGKTIGPLTFDQFKAVCRELKVPATLELRPIDHYRR